MECSSGNQVVCTDCSTLVDASEVRSYRFTDPETAWIYWTTMCPTCDRRQWHMYKKLEPRPQWCGPGHYAYFEWNELLSGYSKWLVQQYHLHQRSIIR